MKYVTQATLEVTKGTPNNIGVKLKLIWDTLQKMAFTTQCINSAKGSHHELHLVLPPPLRLPAEFISTTCTLLKHGFKRYPNPYKMSKIKLSLVS